MAIQIRRGTDTEWEANKSNIVVGEPAITTDTKRFFVGTGTGTYAEFANQTDVDALDTDINASTTGLKDRMTAVETDIAGLGDVSELDYDVVSSSPTTIIQLKDGNTDVYPVGVSSLDYDVVSTTDDSVVLADYVVDMGTKATTYGTWKYRKYKSGFVEAIKMIQISLSGGSSALVAYTTELNTLFDVSNVDASNTFLSVQNADALTNGVHLQSVSYDNTNSWYAVLPASTSGSLKVTVWATYFA